MLQCDWLSEPKAVDGWTVKETIHDIIDGVAQKSYSITACPLYEKHTHKRVKQCGKGNQ